MFAAGITPKITNEVGLYVDTDLSSAKKTPRSAMLNAQGTKLHRLQTSKNKDDSTLVAFPNDRAGSIRPSEHNQKYRYMHASQLNDSDTR